MGFSAFSRFNGGFRFSSRAPHGRRIYEALKSGQGDTYEESFDGRQSARLYAAAMSLAAAQYQTDRALNNASPLTATELLGKIENDYQIVPNYNQTLQERRVIADARLKVTRGARRESVEDALRTLLGSDFVAYETTGPGDRMVWPAAPGDVGAFKRAGSPKKAFRLTEYVGRFGVPLEVSVEKVEGLDLPMPGETLTVEPDTRHPHIEKITITAATDTTITATFGKPHAKGALALTPHPAWISSQRYSRVVVSFAAATNPETRRKVNEVMSRMLRGVSRWFICHDQGSWLIQDPQRGLLDRTVLA